MCDGAAGEGPAGGDEAGGEVVEVEGRVDGEGGEGDAVGDAGGEGVRGKNFKLNGGLTYKILEGKGEGYLRRETS